MIKTTNEKLTKPKDEDDELLNTLSSAQKSLKSESERSETNTSMRSSKFKSSMSTDSKTKVSLKRSLQKLEGKKLKFMKESGRTMDDGNEIMDMKLKDVMAIVKG